MLLAIRIALGVLLLSVAQSPYALNSTTDSSSPQAGQLVERYPGVPRATEYTGKQGPSRILPKVNRSNEHQVDSSSGLYTRGVSKPAAATRSTTSNVGKGGISFGVFARKEASAPGGTCPGEVINYTLEMENTSDVEAGPGVGYIEDLLDPNVNFVSGSLSANIGAEDVTAFANFDGEFVTWEALLFPGERVVVTFQVVIKDVDNGTIISNDPFFELDYGTPVLTLSLPQPLELEVQCSGVIRALGTKSAVNPFGGCPGDPIFYTITLTNLSDIAIGTLPGAIEDFIDDDVNLDEISATDEFGENIGDLDFNPVTGLIEWTGDLAVGETVFIDFVVIVKDVPDWTPILNDPEYDLGPLNFLLPRPIILATICTDFIIDEGMTGSFFDTEFNGQGINIEILLKDEDGLSGLAVVYWYSYGFDGYPFFAFGVGTYIGNIMFIEMLFDLEGDGPFFGPGWNISDFEPDDFTSITILAKDCDKLGFYFTQVNPFLYPWHIMNMDRLTNVAGIPCPFQDLGPAGDKQLGPVQSPARPMQPVARPALKPLLDGLSDATLEPAGGRERVYEKLGLNARPAPKQPAETPVAPAQEAEKGFTIPVGMTGSFFDPSFNGQGINLEILSMPSADKGLFGSVLVYWYTFDLRGLPMFMFGVGTFTGNTMVIDMLVDYDGTGPFFGPLWNPLDFFPTAFGTVTIVWAGCDIGLMTFVLNSAFLSLNPGFVAHPMDLERLTSISKVPCLE